LQRFMSSHYRVLTVVVYGKMGQVHLFGERVENCVMAVENLVCVTLGVIYTEHHL